MSLSICTDAHEISLFDSAISVCLICCIMFTLPILVISQQYFQGWATGMAGPAFPDLSQIAKVDLASASWLFSVGGAG